MVADLTIITATIEGREELFERAVASVRNQSLMPRAHLQMLDSKRKGGAITKNRLIDFADTEWLMILDDDDVLLPNHVEVLYSRRDDADIIYSYANGDNRYNRPFSVEGLLADSIVSHTALFRRSMFHNLGRFEEKLGYDYMLWKKAHEHGYSFLSIPDITWHYDLALGRPHESLGGLPWAAGTD
jgi:glycosyltransferase involved in cell wall biosynthesis